MYERLHGEYRGTYTYKASENKNGCSALVIFAQTFDNCTGKHAGKMLPVLFGATMTERTHLTTAKEPGEASSQKTPKKQGEGRKTYLLSPRAYEIAVEFKTLAGRYTVSEFISACICAYGPSLISRYRDSPDSALADREDASLKELQTMMRKHAHASWRKRESAAKQAAYAALVEKLRAAKTLRQHQQFIEEAASLPELKAQALRDRAKQNKKLKKTSREEWAVLLKHRNEFLSL